LVKNKKSSTKSKKGKSGNHQKIVEHLAKSPTGEPEIEITPDTSIKDFFANIEKKFGFNLHDLVPVFTDELISTVGDLMEDPDWVNQVQLDQKYVEVIQHSLAKLQGRKRTASTVPIRKPNGTKTPAPTTSPDMAPPPPIPDEKSPEVAKSNRGSIDTAAMAAPPPPPPESDEDDEDEDEDEKPKSVSKDSDAAQVKNWLESNGFDTTPFEDKNGEEFFATSKQDLKKIYGVATGVRLYNRRQSLA